MTSFSPTTYLTSQGWDGPGTALKKGGLKKPITVAHKTNLKGIGKERDTGYAWWDDVFSMVANKGKDKGKAGGTPVEVGVPS
jgi:nucleolar protein TMA23